MRCINARESLSARLDGEVIPISEPAVDHHLAGCTDCQEWLRAAEALTRQVRIAPAPDLDLLAEKVLAAIDDHAAPDGRERRAVRLALCLVALAQLAITIPILILGHDREAPLHVTHEMGAWDAALAIGLLLAARRPSRAEGMSAIVGVGALLLVTTACIDLVAGRTSVTDETPHLLCVAGWLLLHRLAVLERSRPRAPLPAAPQPTRPAVGAERDTGSRTPDPHDGDHAAQVSA